MRWTALLLAAFVSGDVLTPSQITISHKKPITATSTCGEINGQPIREVYCSLTGSSQYTPFTPYSYHDDAETARTHSFQELRNPREAMISGGHGCGHCDASNPNDAHPASNMVDGNTSWWQSPPLSRGMQFNQVNITLDLEQLFHVAYVWITMANSPRPANWILERSADGGKTFQPWMYFAENQAECMRRYGMVSLGQIEDDGTVICRHDMARIHPLENGEIMISLMEDRPSRHNFATSEALQNFTKATHVRLVLQGTRTLQGHLMDLNDQTDPSVTRRYFYAIKEIIMGGRCVCNGHASTCDILDPRRQRALLCRCEHNTCGDMCEQCCPGFEQKKWQPTTATNNFTCEPCNCFGRSNECQYEEELDVNKKSLDIRGIYEGGGRCQNCRFHTTGINCNECERGYFKPAGVSWEELMPCKACVCDPSKHTGSCADGTGKCECQARFEGEDCDRCAKGYYSPPECKKCDCAVEGTIAEQCLPEDGQCPCKPGFGGTFCETCASGFTNYLAGCIACECDEIGAENSNCSAADGQCVCKSAYTGKSCASCQIGYFGFPDCTYCNCDPSGTEGGMCDQSSGQCLCKEGFVGEKCDQCDVGYYGYPNCRQCECDFAGSSTPECDKSSGQCPCLGNFTGRTCDKCAAGFFDYPYCKACSCLIEGAKGQTCDSNGQCYCKGNFEGERCDRCKPNFYNFPACEECNCNPSGVTPDFAGCDKVAPGELCSCRANVMGRICDQCKPTFWDLQYHHAEGCVTCDCNLDGTLSRTNFCNQKTGQCECKRNAGGRRCDKCAEGYYNLRSTNHQGCQPCNCDIGGSLRADCDMTSGQCRCRPRVTGIRCDRPIDNHYFPTLWHNQYEAEDGRTPEGHAVRWATDQEQFPGFSWRGYAVFSPIQEKILIDIDITKSSVYRLLFKYHCPTSVPITAHVTISPQRDSTHDQQQTEKASFMPTSSPSMKEITVNGKPFVLNPGRWVLEISTKQRLFLDYVVVIPSEYYEGVSLRERESSPCLAKSLPNSTCIDLLYPPFPQAARADLSKNTDTFNYVNGDGTKNDVEMMPVELLPEEVGKAAFIRSDNNSRVVQTELDVPEDGEYVVLAEYHNLDDSHFPVRTEVSQDGNVLLNGSLVIHHCPYATFCRELVTKDGVVPFVLLNSGIATVQLFVDPMHEFGLASINLIKKTKWNNDYLIQVPVCVRQNGKCQAQEHPPAANSIVAEAEHSNKELALPGDKVPMDLTDSDLMVVPLDEVKGTIEIQGVVPQHGHHMFLVNYLNPDNTPLDLNVLLQYNDQFTEGTVHFAYCPSVSGCRSIIRNKDRPEVNSFHVDDKYTVTFYYNDTQKGPIYIDSVLAVPFHSYSDYLMQPKPIDISADFVEQCGENFFQNHPSNVSNFCRDKIFSLTMDYNAAAFSCDCNAKGSGSFACETYGGQCHCKANIIGRRCDRCAPGFYNFPECIKCKCPNNHQCDEETGQCFCPPHVEGTTCDRCVSHAFGYDPLIGCQLCGCHPHGSEGGIQQCDPDSGQCLCRESVGGRRCDRCLAGFYGFPSCYECRCHRAGTTEEICNPSSARCDCKHNVYGGQCEQCKPGTFDLSEENHLGCADCFCFGTTDQCRSSMYPVHIGAFDMSAFIVDDPFGRVSWDEETLTYHADENSPSNVYFNVPIVQGGDYTSSYGLMMTFQLVVTPRDGQLSFSNDPDVRLYGNNMTAEFWAQEQPANPEESFTVRVKLVPENFATASGKPFTREELMMLLYSLQNITLKASYFENPLTAQLLEFGLEISSPNAPRDAVIFASSVEQCLCPAPYTGSSCQECAQGFYRVEGSFLGACVPCDCNGHSDNCDPNTGVCSNCEDNTHGDHCELCNEGFYGDATTGSPYSCMACACPYSQASNNFAKSCDVSGYGEMQQCYCKEGYTGERCERCSPGFYGEPNRLGGSCQPCQCNNNNNLTDPRSCHPISGDCYQCVDNTYGRHCEWCAPWFHGDAIEAKNCEACSCDQCGSSRCDNQNGLCECKPNVVGAQCDRCAPDHWGFSRCGGCHACHCAIAASSGQCQGATGQCACRPGAAGLRCEHCEQGFWNYGEHGCQKCDCEADLSMGTVCDVRTGQCHCQEGATGPRCDQCERSYLRIPTLGCRRCDECVFHLINDLDLLSYSLDALNISIGNISSSTVVGARLSRSSKALEKFTDLTGLLSNDNNEYNNFIGDAQAALTSKAVLFNSANRSHAVGVGDSLRVRNLTDDALKVLQDSRERIQNSRRAVSSVRELVAALGSHASALVIDPKWIESAQSTLLNLESISASEQAEQLKNAPQQLKIVSELLEGVKEKVKLQSERITSGRDEADKIAQYIADAQKELKKSKFESEAALKKARGQTLFKLDGLVKAINDDIEKLSDEKKTVESVLLEVNNRTEASRDNREQIEQCMDSLTDLRAQISEQLEGGRIEKRNVDDFDKASIRIKAHELTQEASSLNGTFGSAKHEAQNAVEAANAYQNLTYTVLSAKEKIEVARELLEAEKEGLGEQKERVAETLSKSKQLVEVAAQLLLSNITELTSEAESVEHTVDRLAEQVETMRRRRAQLQDSLIFGEISAEDVTAKVKKVNSLTENVEKALESSHEQLKNTKQDSDSVIAARTDAVQAVKTAKNNINELQEVAPGLTASFGRMKNLYENNSAKLDSIQDKVAQVKEMIAVARNAANRIRLGAHFERDSSLDLQMPLRVSRSVVHTDLSFYFRTPNDHGIPVFFGNEEGSAGTRAVPTDDYVAIEIEYGTPKVSIDLGDAPLVVKLKTQVSDNRWRRLSINRIGRTATVSLSKPDSDEIGEEVTATSEGNKSLLNLHQTMSKLFVGGVPRNSRIASEVRNREFVGDVEDLQLHGEPVGLWNAKPGGMVKVNGAQKRPRNSEVAERNAGVSLNGGGYIVLNRGTWNPRLRTVFSLQFLTYSPDGQLLFLGKDRHFLALELSLGAVKLSVDFGSGVGQWSTNENHYNDGKWHTVTVLREGIHVKLQIDGKTMAEGSSPGLMSKMEVTEFVYLGGTPPGINMRSPVEPLRGCLKAVRFNNDEVDLQGFSVRASKDVRNACPLGSVNTVSILSERSSVVFPSVNVSEELEVALRFKTRESVGSLITVKTEEEDLLSLNIKDSKLVVTSGDDKLILELASTSDEQWHFVSVRKNKDTLRIDVDDLHSMQAPYSNGDDLVSTASVVLGQQESGAFVGCVGDVTINGKLLDFSKAKINEVSLTGCSLKDDLIRATISPTDEGAVVDIPTSTEPSTTSSIPTTEDVAEVRPIGSCALPLQTRGPLPESEAGIRYGAAAYSRSEYTETPDTFDKNAAFTLSIRPTASSGVLFFATNEKHTDHIGLFLVNNSLTFSFDAGVKLHQIRSEKNLLDGRWHAVTAIRRGTEAQLIVDDESNEIVTDEVDAIDTQAPLYVGGVSAELATFVRQQVPGVKAEFAGCLRDLKLNDKEFLSATQDFNIVPCSAFYENGVYFGPGKGYAILKKEYHIGPTFSAELEIRPRVQDAILFSIGKVEYLTLQLLNGTVKFTVDSGAGAQDIQYVPVRSENNPLCDGHWHTIKIMKKRSLMTLTVDGKSNLHVIKGSKKTDTVTKDPIYLGGVPKDVTNKGLETSENYIGCIRINGYGDKKSRLLRKKKQLDVGSMEVIGDVIRQECPVN